MAKDDLPDCTWAELKERMKDDPALAERFTFPVPKSIFAREEGDDRPHFTLRFTQMPDLGAIERGKIKRLQVALAPIMAKLDALKDRATATDVAAEILEAIATEESPPLKPMLAKRENGRPTRKREIRRLLVERWADGTMVASSLAEEARQIAKALRERERKGGIHVSNAPIPLPSTIENIIRNRYARLRKSQRR